MIGRIAASVLLVLAVAACAGGERNWTKHGAGDEVVLADYEECRGEARAVTQRDSAIDTDILATRGTDWANGGTLTLKRDEMAASSRSNAQRIIGGCMTAKGYQPAR